MRRMKFVAVGERNIFCEKLVNTELTIRSHISSNNLKTVLLQSKKKKKINIIKS